jgi:tRNA splicing endonuclease
MGDPKRGLYDKFTVLRNDGTSQQGGKHFGCEYFVLDLNHDKHARAAILAYADSCESDFPLLARDLRAKFPTPVAEPQAEQEQQK